VNFVSGQAPRPIYKRTTTNLISEGRHLFKFKIFFFFFSFFYFFFFFFFFSFFFLFFFFFFFLLFFFFFFFFFFFSVMDEGKTATKFSTGVFFWAWKSYTGIVVDAKKAAIQQEPVICRCLQKLSFICVEKRIQREKLLF